MGEIKKVNELIWLINTHPLTLNFLNGMWKKYGVDWEYTVGPPIPKNLEQYGIVGLYSIKETPRRDRG